MRRVIRTEDIGGHVTCVDAKTLELNFAVRKIFHHSHKTLTLQSDFVFAESALGVTTVCCWTSSAVQTDDNPGQCECPRGARVTGEMGGGWRGRLQSIRIVRIRGNSGMQELEFSGTAS